MPAAFTPATHVVPLGSGADGVSVKVVAGEAVGSAGDTEKVRPVPAGQARLKAPEVALTGSLNVMAIAWLTSTFGAFAAGVVLLTVGALSTVALPFAVTEKSSIARP